ncbi:hypothetical protein IEQ34_004526 [Dendrobium chrysotoxum]|uniref:Uncharacterized protein n=1 Tax=Dendrobium chrysotoxum TaxID=161865 RepID=A0AAV7HIG8_DENCH|nr:hypothetical protein IEQ34_004526 [Dendrobium chrysotoxum]
MDDYVCGMERMLYSVRNAGGRNPGTAGDKAADAELPGLGSTGDDVVSGPVDPARRAGSGAGATEVTLDGALDGGEVRGGCDDGVVDGDSGILVGISSSLSGDRVLLAAKGLAGVDIAVLEDDGGVAEDEVDGAVDVAVAVELALAVDVDGVLVSLKAAAVEDGEVGA